MPESLGAVCQVAVSGRQSWLATITLVSLHRLSLLWLLTLCGIIIDMSLRDLRQQSMMTQREVAQRAGITVTTLSRIENGKVVPSFRTVRSLAAVFGISPQQMHEIVTSSQLPLWAAETRLGRRQR